MKNQKGITLIALVVTIVVLLILAGTSIAMLGGDNGIITNAQDAAAANTEGEVIDKMNVAYNTVKANIITKSSTIMNWDATKTENELALAKTIAGEILTATEAEKLTAENPLQGTGKNSGYTITYTKTAEGVKGTVKIEYTDATFNLDKKAEKPNRHYPKITCTIEFSSDDATYTPPTRHVNQ